MTLRPTRRAALLGLTSAFAFGRVSLALAAAPTEQRFVVVILRGALDGLSAVVPYGDAALPGLRGQIAPPAPGQDGGTLDLGGFYGLHPALADLHDMYRVGELLVVHAVAGPFRSRSHFEAQDYLETGAEHRMTSGWLNRAVASLPAASQPGAEGDAIAIGVAVPLLLRGPAPVANWAPQGFATPESDLYARVAALSQDDAVIGPAIREGLRDRGFSASVMTGDQPANNRYAFPPLAAAAGRMLRAPDGPRIAALEIGGWDTHTAQVARLAGPLKQLNAGLAALKATVGDAWRQTAVLVMTEFGRAVRVNGNRGTDHGTGTVAFVLGGAVAGGRIAADWPGLGAGRLFEDRDLQPTADLCAVAKGLLAQHLGLDAASLAQVFPGSEAAPPMRALIRA